MTTNQTIDGVRRELLERIEYLMRGAGGDHMCITELRALLDGPAKEQQWVSVEALNRVSTELEELKAAQLQGEPVAWRFRVSDTGDWFATTKALVAEMFHNSSDGGQAQPLYAEQPAPVAVALPDRDTLRDLIAQAIGGDTYDCTRVWSAWSVGTMSSDDFVPVVDQEARLYEITDACLEEFTRLNAQ